MSDQQSSLPLQPDRPQTDRAPSANTVAGEAVEQLRTALPRIREADQRLAHTAEMLIKGAADPVRANGKGFAHEIAYAVQDIERTVGRLPLSDDARAGLVLLASSAPGLQNRRLQELLASTGEMTDRALVRELRRAGIEIGQEANQDTPAVRSRIEVLENRARLAARPESAASNATAASAAASQPGAANAGSGPASATGQQPGQGAAAQAPHPPRQQPQYGGLVTPTMGEIVMNTLLRGFRAPGSADTPPWEPATTPMQGRLNAFEARLQRERDGATLHGVEASGRAALDALQGFQTGEGAVVLNRIREAAQGDPGGMPAVLAEMRPGGRFAELRQQFSNAYADEKGFAAAYDRAASALAGYGDRRAAAETIIARQPDASGVAAKFEAMERELAEAAGEIPSRRNGKSMLEDLGRQTADMLHRALEGVRNIFGRGASATAGPSASPSPS